MDREYQQMTRSEAQHFAKISEKLTRTDVKTIQSVLKTRMLEAGYESDDIPGIVDGMTERFVEEDMNLRKELMEEELRKNGFLKQDKIEATDDQIVKAIKKTLPNFKSERDWGGVYLILVSCCDFPPVKTKFVVRFWEMGIYAKDNPKCVEGLTREMPPAIYIGEYCGYPFSYQAVQKGFPTTWSLQYEEFVKTVTPNRDFSDRKEIAVRFKRELQSAVSRHTIR